MIEIKMIKQALFTSEQLNLTYNNIICHQKLYLKVFIW